MAIGLASLLILKWMLKIPTKTITLHLKMHFQNTNEQYIYSKCNRTKFVGDTGKKQIFEGLSKIVQNSFFQTISTNLCIKKNLNVFWIVPVPSSWQRHWAVFFLLIFHYTALGCFIPCHIIFILHCFLVKNLMSN